MSEYLRRGSDRRNQMLLPTLIGIVLLLISVLTIVEADAPRAGLRSAIARGGR
jgi:hypothetical protein